MATDKTVKYQVTAENTGYLKSMEEIAAASLAAEAAIKGAFGNVGAAFGAVMDHIGALVAVLGGGAAFGKGIETTKELTGEAVKLSKALGLPVEQASHLNVALREIGSSADVYTDANAKLTRQIRTNEGAVNNMGVATRGANGQLLDGNTIMRNALTALSQYKEGTDRNLAGQQLFGKGAEEVRSLLKLLAVDMEAAAAKAKALGLEVGPEQAERVKAYKEAMEDVHLVVDAVQNVIGQSAMPRLTQLAQWLAGVGPAVVQVFREALSALSDVMQTVMDVVLSLWGIVRDVFTAIVGETTDAAGVEIPDAMTVWRNAMDLVRLAALSLKAGIVVVFEFIRGQVLVLVEELRRFAGVAIAAFNLDWEGVKAAWDTGSKKIEAVIADSQERILKKTADTAAQMAAILNGEKPASSAPVGPPSSLKPGGTKSYKDPKGPQEDALKAQFAVLRAQLEGELALQKELLKEAQEAYDDAYRHNRITVEQFFAAKLAIEQKDLQSSIAIKQQELQEAKALEQRAIQTGAKDTERLALKAKEIQITAQLAVLTAQLANTEIKNARELNDELLKRQNRMLEIQRISQQQASTSGVSLERIALEQRRALRQVDDAQALQQEKALQEKLYQIDLAATRAKYALADGDPIKIAEIDAEVEQVERRHVEEMAKIDRDLVVEQNKVAVEARDAMERDLGGFVTSLGDRTKSVKDKFKDLFASIERDALDLAGKNIAKQLMNSLFGQGVGPGAGGGGIFGDVFSLFAKSLTSFDVGTPYVPHDMVAIVHRGERITTASDNAAGRGGGRQVQVVNNFHFQGAVDPHTQLQVARAAGRSIAAATSRNG